MASNSDIVMLSGSGTPTPGVSGKRSGTEVSDRQRGRSVSPRGALQDEARRIQNSPEQPSQGSEMCDSGSDVALVPVGSFPTGAPEQ